VNNKKFTQQLDRGIRWAGRNIGLILLILAAIVFVGAINKAWADDDCRGNQNCTDTGGGDIDITGGDVNVPVEVNTDVTGGPVSVQHKSESLGIGLSNSLGDVDIAGCLGSTQWATPLFSKQKLVVNWPCLAEFYLKNGKYELAAMAICNTEIIKEFEDEAACEAAHDFGPQEEPVSEILEQRQQIEEYHQEDIQVVQMAQASLEARLTALEQKPPPPPRVIRSQPAEPDKRFTEEQKLAVFAALGMDEDDE
jgi:hypothetical protein